LKIDGGERIGTEKLVVLLVQEKIGEWGKGKKIRLMFLG